MHLHITCTLLLNSGCAVVVVVVVVVVVLLVVRLQSEEAQQSIKNTTVGFIALLKLTFNETITKCQ